MVVGGLVGLDWDCGVDVVGAQPVPVGPGGVGPVRQNPAEVKSGLEAAIDMIENETYFISANDDDTIAYYAHCISRTGSYLSEGAGVAEGEALAYLIAPPLEAMYAVDAAIKAADVKLCVLYAPPSETNFGGALLTGSQSACKSACDAFAAAVEFVADNPVAF